MKRKPAIAPRKQPNQERAKDTVDAILRATAHILRKEGVRRATTNHIAEVAGVSIGSLYQYFPSREAVIGALLEQHAAEMQARLQGVIIEVAGAPLETSVRRFISVMIEAHKNDPVLHRVLSEELPALGGMARLKEVLLPGEAMVRAYLVANAKALRKVDPDLATFVLVNAVEAITHRFALMPSEIDTRALIDEVSTLVLRYLRP